MRRGYNSDIPVPTLELEIGATNPREFPYKTPQRRVEAVLLLLASFVMPVVSTNDKETNKVNGEEESSNSDGDSSSCK